MNKYSEYVTNWLVEAGYTHCFFVPGGNSMHLLDGVRKQMVCVAFVHEMSATIAAEYFNQVSPDGRAFVLLTAGPGLTNALTGIAGAYHESRELLVIGGQVKSSDLTDGSVRQRGIQEVDGVKLAEPVTVLSRRLTTPVSKADFLNLISFQWRLTPGPVFIEMCLDVQGAPYQNEDDSPILKEESEAVPEWRQEVGQEIAQLLQKAERPVLLIGGGVDYAKFQSILPKLEELKIPIMTTYNGADRLASDHPLYFGRPNTWGMRYANLLIGQADLVIALGTRLGLQQTGFNWQEFVPSGKIVHVDIANGELYKGHPVTHLKVCADASDALARISNFTWTDKSAWLEYCARVKASLPLSESANSKHHGFHNPYDFLLELSSVATNQDVIVPSSSGGAFTAFYQAFLNKQGQRIVSDKSLASMGYGLAGSIGAALANPNRRIIHVEGDGSFSQNLQELATIAVRNLNVKTFLWSNEGYASIRMTQRNYFGGEYLGCDIDTGLGFPDWEILGRAYGIDVVSLKPDFSQTLPDLEQFNRHGPAIFLVRLHREQTFFPKIASRITVAGSMESEPLWQISPHLSEEELSSFGKYLPAKQ